MQRLTDLFERKQRDILNVYFTAGYPQRDDTGVLIRALTEAGVDLIEVGMPYSDPLADGPTIQESGTQAIENGMTVALLFEQIRAVRPFTDVPLVLMGYFNQVLQYGFDRFIADCVAAGVDGIILPDLPVYEYEQWYRAKVEAAGLGISFLITPQTTPDRIRKIDSLSRGFVYMVSSAAITGATGGISAEQIAYFERVGAMALTQPRLIGFGISNADTYQTACRYAQGAIIGSAFIKALAGSTDVAQAARDFVRGIR